MTTTALRGGEIIDQAGRRRGDVLVDDVTGRIAAVGEDLAGDVVLDATSCLICPGFVDLHVHLRQPGFEGAGTIESGARAAALGGYTAVVAAADTDPCADSAAVVSEVLALAKDAVCEIVPAAALTVDRAGDQLAPYRELVELGVRLFSDTDRTVHDAVVVRHALDYLRGVAEATGTNPVVGQRNRHPLTAAGVMNEGEWSSRLGLPGQPAVGEELSVHRDVALARLTGSRLHLQQLSTAASVALVRAAKAENVRVTAEVSPHHLVLTDAAVADYDPSCKVDPPLRTERDVLALRAAVADGTIDAIATDHAPCTIDAKERPFDSAPYGVLGLETALGVLLTETELTIDQLLPALAWQPAAVVGLSDRHGGPIAVNLPANLTVIDPATSWTVDPERFGGYATNNPFLGRRLTGRVRHTVHRGEPVVVDSEPTR